MSKEIKVDWYGWLVKILGYLFGGIGILSSYVLNKPIKMYIFFITIMIFTYFITYDVRTKINKSNKIIKKKEKTLNSMLNSIIPISRFNKGDASEIFDEVNKSGYKIIVKNNKPTCVLITPETYQEMVEIIENYNLYVEAEKRMKTAKDDDFISSEDILLNLKIIKEELNSIEVDIE